MEPIPLAAKNCEEWASSIRGKDAADLVRHMRINNLRFAPSTEGTGAAYHQIHLALRDLDTSHRGGVQVAGR